MKHISLILSFIVLLLSSCSSGKSNSNPRTTKTLIEINSTITDEVIIDNNESNEENQTIPDTVTEPLGEILLTDDTLYGKWIYVNSGEPLEMLATSNIVIEKLTQDLIKQTKENGQYFLTRASVNKASVVGKIDYATSQESNDTIATLENIADRNIFCTAVIDAAGRFTCGDIPSGSYELVVKNKQLTALTSTVNYKRCNSRYRYIHNCE